MFLSRIIFKDDIWIVNKGYKRSTQFKVIYTLLIISIPLNFILFYYLITGEIFLDNIHLCIFSSLGAELIIFFSVVGLYVLYKDETYVKLILYKPGKFISRDELKKYIENYLTSKSLEFEKIIDAREYNFYKRYSFRVSIRPQDNKEFVESIWFFDISGENELLFDELKRELIEKYKLSDDARPIRE